MTAASDSAHVALLLASSSYEEYLRGLFRAVVSAPWDGGLFPMPEGLPKGTSLATMAAELNQMASRVRELKETKTQEELDQVGLSLFQNFVSDVSSIAELRPLDVYNTSGGDDRWDLLQANALFGQGLTLAPHKLFRMASDIDREQCLRAWGHRQTLCCQELRREMESAERMKMVKDEIRTVEETHGLLSMEMIDALSDVDVSFEAPSGAQYVELKTRNNPQLKSAPSVVPGYCIS